MSREGRKLGVFLDSAPALKSVEQLFVYSERMTQGFVTPVFISFFLFLHLFPYSHLFAIFMLRTLTRG